MYAILFVLNDPNRLNEIIAAWEKAGIHGATIFESSGLQRIKLRALAMRHLPAIYNCEEDHLTLLALVSNEAPIQPCLQATESIVGDLNDPDTGVFAAWPLSFVKGIPDAGVSHGLD